MRERVGRPACFLILLVGVFLTSCKSTTEMNGEILHKPPGVGSRFKYRVTVFDSLLQLKDSNFREMSVVKSGLAFGGKHDILEIEEGPHALYYHIDSVGDFANASGALGQWIRYPVHSKKTVVHE